MPTFRLRPRLRGVAATAMGIGGAILAGAAAVGGTPIMWASGAAGIVFGGLYLVSPTWRLRVVVDDAGLEVGTARRPRFRLAWSDVVKVIASPSTRTCFVDGGAPERSLMVPGDGAPAPYEIEGSGELYDAILARVPADRVIEVALLETYKPT
jgi:hypothetical protein